MGHLAIIAGAAQAGGAILGGISEQGAANAQSQIAKSNAEIARNNAELTSQAGETQASNLGFKNRAQMGAIKAGQASSGIDISSKSARDVRDSQQALGLLDTQTLRSNAAREAFGYKVKEREFRNEAKLATNRGKAAMIGAALSAASSLAGGVQNQRMANLAMADASPRSSAQLDF